MKFIVLALFCSVAFAAAQLEPEAYYGSPRVRRQDRGSLVIHGEKPMSGPDRRPSLDVDYHQRVLDRNGMTANTYGGLNIRPGQPPQPHAGIQLQRNFKDGFIGGFGQVQRRPGGGPSPTFGISGGYRFRRDVDEPVDDEIAPQY